jgi:hypothetical protein
MPNRGSARDNMPAKFFSAINERRSNRSLLWGMVAHDYPWRACRTDFTRARGSQGSWTATRRAAGAALTATAPS